MPDNLCGRPTPVGVTTLSRARCSQADDIKVQQEAAQTHRLFASEPALEASARQRSGCWHSVGGKRRIATSAKLPRKRHRRRIRPQRCTVRARQVKESWEKVAQLSTKGHVTLTEQFIQIAGEVAYELGVEHGELTLAGQPVTSDCRVTNIYRRESGVWKVIHHHTDIAPTMLGVISRLGREP
jgi:SnoaL-like domain